MNIMPQEQIDILFALNRAPGGGWYAARQSGLYRSSDDGQTWQTTYGALNLDAPLATPALALSPDFARDGTLAAGVHGGVLISRDGGENWKAFTFPAPASTTAALALSPDFAHDGLIVAGTTEDGIYRLEGGDEHWHAWNFGLLDRRVLCLALSPDFAHDRTILAGTETGLYRSANGGRSWQDAGMPEDFAPVFCLALLPGGVIFAGSESGGLLRALDGGQTWTPLIATDDAVNSLQAAPPHLVALVGGQVQVSHDDGTGWSILPDIDDATAIAAPEGLTPGQPVWIGREDGTVLMAHL